MHTYIPTCALSHALLSSVHSWHLLLVIHCQTAHCGAESNVVLLWHFNSFDLPCPNAGFWEHSSKSCSHRTRTLCGTYTLFIVTRGGVKSFVAFPRHWAVATLFFCCTKYILRLPSVVKFPTSSLPEVLIGLEESKLTGIIWAFRLMLFIIIFHNGETIAAIFWNRTSSWVHSCSKHLMPLTHEAFFSWEISQRITKIRAWWFTVKTEGHICATPAVLWPLKKGGVLISSDGWLSVQNLSWNSVYVQCTQINARNSSTALLWCGYRLFS